MNLVYRLTTDTVIDDTQRSFSVYGIEVVRDGDHVEVIKSVPAVSIRKDLVESVIKLCNKVNLSPIHLEDIIMDEIIQIENPFDRYKKAARQKRAAFILSLFCYFAFCKSFQITVRHCNQVQMHEDSFQGIFQEQFSLLFQSKSLSEFPYALP